MKNEAMILPIIAAVIISIAACISLFWTSPVFIGLAGACIFAIVLKTGWYISDIDNVAGVGLLNLVGMWLWFALVAWFGLIGPLQWPWFAAALTVLLGLAGLVNRHLSETNQNPLKRHH